MHRVDAMIEKSLGAGDADVSCGTRTRFLGALFCALLPLVGLLLAPGASGQAPVLGSPAYLSPNSAGFGTAAPKMIYNGGVPSGLIANIRWSGWGRRVAKGQGSLPIYRPQGGYYARRASVRLRTRGLGECPGFSQPAYTQLEFRHPNWPGGPLGPWFKWSGTRDLCDYGQKDPAYEYPRRPPGDCGATAEPDVSADSLAFYYPGDTFQVMAFRMGCAQAIRIARRSAKRIPDTLRCFRRGCRAKVSQFRCRWWHVFPDEEAPPGGVFPAQRVVCRRGHSVFSGFHVSQVA